MTNKKFIVGSSVIIIVIIGVIFAMFFTKTINPQSVLIKEINVTDNVIEVQGMFTDGLNHFKGYKTKYIDETLFIKIKGGISLLSKSSGGVNISMSNTFGTIKEIYLEDDSGNKVLIWPKK